MSYGEYKAKCEKCGKLFHYGQGNAIKLCYGCKRERAKQKSLERRKVSGVMTSWERDRFIILERDHFRCIYCGATPFNDEIKLHVDHVIPRSHGGDDRVSNLVTACERCNVSKGFHRHPTDIEEELINVIKIRNRISKIVPEQIIKLAYERKECTTQAEK